MPTSYMLLDLPVVGATPGPTYATLNNDAFTAIDSHDHSVGKGTKVTPAGLNINQDLPFANFNLTGIRQTRFQDQAGNLSLSADNGGFYRNGDDIYWRDGAGNNVRITTGGNVNTSGSGNISGMGATTAAVTYSDITDTFTFTHNTNLSAKLDASEITIREYNLASANGITLKSPAALAGAYSVTLWATLPAGALPVRLSATGVLTAEQLVAGDLATDSVTTPKIQNAAVTFEKVAAGMQVGRAFTQTAALAGALANIPFDNTKPQVGEGTEVLTLDYTPKKVGNKVSVRAVVPVGIASIVGTRTIVRGTVALFRDAAADAVSAVPATPTYDQANTLFGGTVAVVLFEETVAALDTITWSVRAGQSSSAGEGAINTNGPSYNLLVFRSIEVVETAQ